MEDEMKRMKNCRHTYLSAVFVLHVILSEAAGFFVAVPRPLRMT